MLSVLLLFRVLFIVALRFCSVVVSYHDTSLIVCFWLVFRVLRVGFVIYCGLFLYCKLRFCLLFRLYVCGRVVFRCLVCDFHIVLFVELLVFVVDLCR